MSDLKSIRVIEFSGRTTDWEGWSEKFLARAKRKGYKKLLVGKETVPKVSAYADAEGKDDATSKKIVKLGDANEEAFEDVILSINHTTKQGKVAFSLVKNCKTSDYPEGNCKLAWDRLVAKYAPKAAPSLLKLKKQFANSKLGDAETHPDEWITELESLRNDMDKISLSAKMTDQDFMIHVLNNLPVEYDVVLDGMESRLMLPDGDANKLTIEDVRDKLNNRFERMDERESQTKEEVAFANFTKQFKGICRNCGKYGHKAFECPDKKPEGKGQGGNKKLICYHCGELGHTSYNCEVKKKAEAMRNKAESMRNKANQETAAWAVDLEEKQEDDLEDYLSDDQSCYYGDGF